MLPAIMGIDVEGFAKRYDKVYYQLRKEPALKAKIGTEWLFEIRNERGLEIVVEANPDMFIMYRVK